MRSQKRPPCWSCTVCRFWTFSCAKSCLLLWSMLQLPITLLGAPNRQRPTSQKRLQRVVTSMSSPTWAFEIRCAALCLQLAMLCTNVSASNKRRPLLLRLAEREIPSRLSQLFSDIVGKLHLDPLLDGSWGEVVERLVVCAGQGIIRFSLLAGMSKIKTIIPTCFPRTC